MMPSIPAVDGRPSPSFWLRSHCLSSQLSLLPNRTSRRMQTSHCAAAFRVVLQSCCRHETSRSGSHFSHIAVKASARPSRLLHTAPNASAPSSSSAAAISARQRGARSLTAAGVLALACIGLYASRDSLHLDAHSNEARRLKKTAKPRLEEALARISKCGIDTSTAEDVLTGFATAPGTTYPPSLPLAVVYPTSTQDVVEIVNACRESRVRMSTLSVRAKTRS